MKPITLSKIQKEKLREMCEAYFPELLFELNDAAGGDHRSSVFYLCIEEEGEEPVADISWYEFCMTELAEKIFIPNPDQIQRGLKDRMCDFFWATNLWWSEKFRKGQLEFSDTWCKHPIDYLFDEFKKQQMGVK